MPVMGTTNGSAFFLAIHLGIYCTGNYLCLGSCAMSGRDCSTRVTILRKCTEQTQTQQPCFMNGLNLHVIDKKCTFSAKIPPF